MSTEGLSSLTQFHLPVHTEGAVPTIGLIFTSSLRIVCLLGPCVSGPGCYRGGARVLQAWMAAPGDAASTRREGAGAPAPTVLDLWCENCESTRVWPCCLFLLCKCAADLKDSF